MVRRRRRKPRRNDDEEYDDDLPTNFHDDIPELTIWEEEDPREPIGYILDQYGEILLEVIPEQKVLGYVENKEVRDTEF